MEDALERDVRAFCDGSYRLGLAVELAEHDLVLAEEDRPEIADVESRRHLRHATVERVEVGFADVGPEALRDEAAGFGVHLRRR
jgi:hypothetical protein